MTSITKRRFSVRSLKNTDPRTENNKTIKILMKLLVINIVANNFLGLSNNLTTTSPLGSFNLPTTSNFVLDKEKNATSVPEIIAEKTNKHSKMITSITKYQGIEFRNVKVGSGSNFIFYVLV